MSKKYIHKQKYWDCQLVCAVNACIFHGLPVPSKKEYEKLVDLTRCRHDAAEDIGAGHYRLGLRTIEMKRPTLKWMKAHLPVDIAILTCHGNFHNVLVTKIKGNRCWVANYYSVQRSNRFKIMPWNKLKALHRGVWNEDWCACRSLQRWRGSRIR